MKIKLIISLILSGVLTTSCIKQSNQLNQSNVDLIQSPEIAIKQKQLERSVKDVVQKVMASSVSVRDGHESFSAVIVSSDGYLLSVGHAVRSNRDYTINLTDGREFKAIGLGSNEKFDMGLMKIVERENLPVAEMGWSSTIKIGQPCISISYPGGGPIQRGPVVRMGYIADPILSNGMIRSTCLMEPGDSGGPLFDMEGRVIGIHSRIQTSLDTNKEVAVDLFRHFWPQMLNGGDFNPSEIHEFPHLGFTYKKVRLEENSDSGRNRVDITSIDSEGINASSGLLQGDRFVSINGEKVRAIIKVSMLLHNAQTLKLSTVDVVVERDGKKINLELPLPVNTKAYDAWSGDAGIRQSEPQLRPVKPVANIEEILQPVAALESVLDDKVVRVQSTKNDNTLTALATVIKQDNQINSSTLLVSKGSLVGDNVEIEYQDKIISADVLTRDIKNDLVLLKVDHHFESGVSLDNVDVKPTEHAEFLLSPHPDTKGRFGVWGSKLFKVDRRISDVYLGVMMEECEGKVLLTDVRDDGSVHKFLKSGDLLLSFNGNKIASPKDLIRELAYLQPGDKVTVGVERESNVFTEEMQLVARPMNMNGGHIADETFEGDISVRRDGFTKVFSHDGRLHSDECGGPVFNIDGVFLGVNIARFSRTRSYALPAEVISNFVNSSQIN